MDNSYSIDLHISVEHVDCFRRLRPSVLMRIFQEVAAAHVESIGLGKEKTLARGLFWVIASNRLLIHRMPKYDENVKVVTYPGQSFLSFLPRQMKIYGQDGELLVEGSSIWCIIDMETRKMIKPSDYGLDIAGSKREDDLPPILSLPCPELTQKTIIDVPYSLTDLNGHLNNTNYADIAFDLIPFDFLESHKLKEIGITFKKEIRRGEEVELSYGEKEGTYFFKNDRFTLKAVF